jgi:hypothetical protein
MTRLSDKAYAAVRPSSVFWVIPVIGVRPHQRIQSPVACSRLRLDLNCENYQLGQNRIEILKVSDAGQSRIAGCSPELFLDWVIPGNQKKALPLTQDKVAEGVTRIGNESNNETACFETPHFSTEGAIGLGGAAVQVFDRPVRKQPRQDHRRVFAGFVTAQKLIH